jgi:peptide/nickel transport system substrate-binding protein
MVKKFLSGNIFYISLVLLMIGLFLVAGLVEAAEKPASKATVTKAVAKAVPKGPQPQYGGVLKIIETVGPKTPFGWPPETVGEGSVAGKPAIEALLRQYYDGHFEPWLATAWKIAPDKSSITFTLRKGVKFHDGTDFNAEAAKFNLEAKKVAKVSGTEDWSSIDVVDDHTVRVNLSRYVNTVLSRFTAIYGAMVSPTAVNKNGIEWARWNPTGTGPFQFVSFERDVSTKYKKFDGYWQKGKPYLDGVEYVYIKDPMTQSASMEAGEAQVLNTETGKQPADLKAAGLNIVTAATGTLCLVPDSVNADSPLANRKVREAVEYAIDREAIAKAKSYGFWVAAYQLPPSGTMAYVKNFQGRKYNPAKAKQLLAEAGYPKGFKTRITPHFAVDRDVLVSIQSYLAKVGITADLDFVDQGKFTDYRRKGWKNGFLAMPFGLFPNYLQSIQTYISTDSLDFPSLKKPAGIDVLLKDALSTLGPEPKRIQKLLKVYFDDVTVIPVHEVGRASVQQKKTQNTGHLKFGVWPEWAPDQAWLNK